jgi:CheY-like chemotaxis protein
MLRRHRQGVKTILVVDDELASAEVLSLILEEEGYRTFCAANARQGLARARALRPALVVLDFSMPVMDGAQIGEALREMPEMRHIHILMNSGLPEELVRAHFSKYDAFLRKPYKVDVALKLIADLLRS